MYLGKLGNMKKEYSVNNFKNKTVLVTGHTGFIGTWMSLWLDMLGACLLYTSPSPRDRQKSRMPSSA